MSDERHENERRDDPTPGVAPEMDVRAFEWRPGQWGVQCTIRVGRETTCLATLRDQPLTEGQAKRAAAAAVDGLRR